jgi:hypothetical protein
VDGFRWVMVIGVMLAVASAVTALFWIAATQRSRTDEKR